MKISKFSVLALSVALALTSGCTYRHPAPTEIQEELVKASRTPGKLAVPEEVLNAMHGAGLTRVPESVGNRTYYGVIKGGKVLMENALLKVKN